jgi:hypothetical protein
LLRSGWASREGGADWQLIEGAEREGAQSIGNTQQPTCFRLHAASFSSNLPQGNGGATKVREEKERLSTVKSGGNIIIK